MHILKHFRQSHKRGKSKFTTIRGYKLNKEQTKRYYKTLDIFNDDDIALAEALYKPIKGRDGRLVHPVFHITKKKIKQNEMISI